MGMRPSRAVMAVHPDSEMRVMLRSMLEAHGCTVATDHSCGDVLARNVQPQVILVDRSLLPHEGIDVLTQLNQRWPEAQIVFLPEEMDHTTKGSLEPQLLGIVERMLKMRPTREILSE
jgi:DNA-binding response OmpR family regulator